MSLETISAKEMERYIDNGNVVIIDIRENYEYKDGHIKNAINIPYSEIDRKSYPFSHDSTIILYCERGNLSLFLGRELSRYGYTVKSLYGGVYSYRGCLVTEE